MSSINPIIILIEILKYTEKNTNLKPEDHRNLNELITKAVFICRKVTWTNNVDYSEPMDIN